MSVVVAEKTCTSCNETKPLSEFYKNTNTRDGHQYVCKPCNRAQVKRNQAKRRKQMGDEAWLAHQREIRNKSYRTGNTKDAAQQQAWSAAQKRLRKAHPDEFEAYYREERYERGLSI